ncbi:MAG: DsbA family protein [Methylovirgula sp.]
MRRTGFRLFVASLGFICLAVFCLGFIGFAQAQDVKPSELTREAILNDPDAPVGGNPKGDVTIVAFEDYNCTRCKSAEPALQKLIKDDGHIRLVYKDWPILAATSTYGAELALAAKYQGKYVAVHNLLMRIPGTGVSKEAMDRALRAAGVDIDRLGKDLQSHHEEIHALIRRNDAQAVGMGFQGTPVFLIGPYQVAAALDYDGFKKVVAQARAQEGK